MIEVVIFKILVVNAAIVELYCGNCFQYVFFNFFSGSFLDLITSGDKFLRRFENKYILYFYMNFLFLH